MKNIYLYLSLVILFLVSCEEAEQKPINIDCSTFSAALLANDTIAVEKQINDFFASRSPHPREFDPEGYQVHFAELARQIDACEDLTLLGASYAGLQTAPPTGRIGIQFTKNGQPINVALYTSYDSRIRRYTATCIF